jgi:hypothetical protein
MSRMLSQLRLLLLLVLLFLLLILLMLPLPLPCNRTARQIASPGGRRTWMCVGER